jgi:N-acetylglucosamine kinase-like BadF-type ATPase
MKEIILAIDGGGSRTRCLAINRDGELLGRSESGASNHLLIDFPAVRQSLFEVIEIALAMSGAAREEIACVSAGLAGVDYDGTGSNEMEDIFREIGFGKMAVNGDMVIAHVGALAGEPGVLALAGTGSSILGIDAEGKRVKVGGWGPIYGDEGSAYGIAQKCLRAAARSFDGRANETALLAGITNALQLDNFSETVSCIYLEKMESRDIASLCRVAYEIAETGDPTAAEIFCRAGEELAEAAAAAARRLRLDDVEAQFSYQGSVLDSCAMVRERFVESLKGYFPNARVVTPRYKPVIGAFLIGCAAVGWDAVTPTLGDLDDAYLVHE